MNDITQAVVTILTAIVGVAILAVLVSQRSNTSQVVGSVGNAFAQSLGAATAPVTGANTSSNFGNGGLSGFSLPNYGLGQNW